MARPRNRLKQMATNYNVTIYSNPAPGTEDGTTDQPHEGAQPVGRLMVSCNDCGESWAPTLKENGEPTRDFRLCPGGCNTRQAAALKILRSPANFTPAQVDAARAKVDSAGRAVRRETWERKAEATARRHHDEAMAELDQLLDDALSGDTPLDDPNLDPDLRDLLGG